MIRPDGGAAGASAPPGASGGALVTYRGAVYPWHCDHMGHMNVMWYVGKFDEASWNLFVEIGLTPGYVRTSNCGMVAVQQTLEYKRELLAGEAVIVWSRVLRVGTTSVSWAHVMVNAETGEVAATCELTGVHLDRHARRPHALPAGVVERARVLLVPE